LAAAGIADHGLKLWHVASAELVGTLSDPQMGMRSVAFSPDGRFLAAGGWDKTLWVWEMAYPASLERLAAHTDVVTAVAFSPDGEHVATGAEDGSVLLWKSGEDREPLQLSAPYTESAADAWMHACAGLTFNSAGTL